jgi:hypothetical protein
MYKCHDRAGNVYDDVAKGFTTSPQPRKVRDAQRAQHVGGDSEDRLHRAETRPAFRDMPSVRQPIASVSRAMQHCRSIIAECLYVCTN